MDKFIVITLSGSDEISDEEINRIGEDLADIQLWQMTGNERDSNTVIAVKVEHKNGQVYSI